MQLDEHTIEWLMNGQGEEPDVAGYLERLFARPPWHADAACRDRPRAWWFPSGRRDASTTTQAKAVCASCTVSDECLEWSLDRGSELDGVWAGLTKDDRAELRRQHVA